MFADGKIVEIEEGQKQCGLAGLGLESERGSVMQHRQCCGMHWPESTRISEATAVKPGWSAGF